MKIKSPAEIKKSILETDFSEKLTEAAETHISFNVETGFVTLYLKTGEYANTSIIKGKEASIMLHNYRPYIPLNVKQKKKKLKPRIFSDLHFHPLKINFERESYYLRPSVLSKTGGDIASAISLFNETRTRTISYIAGIYSKTEMDIGILAFQLSKEYAIKNKHRISTKIYPLEELEELKKNLEAIETELEETHVKHHAGNRMISKYLNEHEYFNSFYFTFKNDKFHLPKKIFVD